MRYLWATLIIGFGTLNIGRASPKDLRLLSTKDFFITNLKTGCQPKGAKADPSGGLLLVAEMCGRRLEEHGPRFPSVSVYDLHEKKLKKIIITPEGAKSGILANTEVEYTLEGQTALVARAEGDAKSAVYPGYGMISAIDLNTLKIFKYIPVNGRGSKIIAARPSSLANPKQQIVYVANYFSDDISVLDITTLKTTEGTDGRQFLTKVVKLKTAYSSKKSGYKIAPRGIGFTSDGRYAIVMATETGSLIVMDAVEHKQIAELSPIPSDLFGRDLNLRHIVLTKDGKTAYLSHMRGNGISRINVDRLIAYIQKNYRDQILQIPESFWSNLMIPFPNGKSFLELEEYPKDHPNFPNKKWKLAHPNTIALDPIDNRYLVVSHRTTSNANYEIVDLSIKGKIDIIDTLTGEVILSLVGGSQPTALEISPDRTLLMSAGFKDDQLYFYDFKKIIEIYEKP